LKPRLNNIGTRKNQSNILCDKISQLIQPMYSNRTIPSQIPNLTKLNVTKRATKLANIKKTEDAAAKKTEDETIKAQEDKKNKINKSIDAAKKTAKEREIGLIEAKIAQLTGDLEIAADLSQIRNINKEIAKLEKSLERGVKGGTRKRIKQISNIRKKKETRKR
jgi:thioredoxin-like negative regulator of GroEL